MSGASVLRKVTISLILALAFVVLSFSSSAYAALGDLVFELGSYGDGDGQFLYPWGVECVSKGNVYVADHGSFRVEIFDEGGKFEQAFWVYSPSDIAVDSSGYIYVTSFYKHRVFVYDANGVMVAEWGRDTGGYGGGSADGDFRYPAGIAIDADDNVYVADTYNHRIQVFDKAGNFITKWGGEGWGDGQFASPYGIAVDSNGYVYVADSYHYRVQVFDRTGTFITKWGKEGYGEGEFNGLPWGIDVDSDGNVFVSDSRYGIQVFDKNGSFLKRWGGGVLGISVTGKGRDYVCAANTGGMIQFFDGKVKNKLFK